LLSASRSTTDTAGKLILLGLFAVLVAVIGLAIRGFERSDRQFRCSCSLCWPGSCL
jgi:hypothetical protein